MLRDGSAFSKAMQSTIDKHTSRGQSDELAAVEQSAMNQIDYQHYAEYAMSGQATGSDGILDSTADISHLDTVHVGNEEDMALGGGGVMDEMLPIDGSPLGSSFDYKKIHDEANLNQELLKEKSAHLEQTDELEM